MLNLIKTHGSTYSPDVLSDKVSPQSNNADIVLLVVTKPSPYKNPYLLKNLKQILI